MRGVPHDKLLLPRRCPGIYLRNPAGHVSDFSTLNQAGHPQSGAAKKSQSWPSRVSYEFP